MNDSLAVKKSIKSYVKREGRLTKSQLYGLDNYWIKYGIEYSPKKINFEDFSIFQLLALVDSLLPLSSISRLISRENSSFKFSN